MRINNNLMSMNTYRQYSVNTTNAAASTEKLSSGYRINRAGDDAAGLAISEKMRAQIRGLNMASKNSQDAISLVQTAEGALNETHSILQRMRELAVQSASDTNDSATVDRAALDAEFQALISEIDDIASKTAFNGKKLLNGDATTTPLVIQTGADAGQTLSITIANMSSAAAGLDVTGRNLLTQGAASTAITDVNAAINEVSTARSGLGAIQNRLQHKINNLDTSSENLSAAESRIRDLDMAKEMTNYTKNNILVQAATAMLAQANSAPQGVLQLLQ